MRALLVTNFAPHYRAPFFTRLARAVDVEYLFFSAGTEPYWQQHLGTATVDARCETIVGRPLAAGLNCNPGLAREMWRRDYDVMVKCINGRTELASAYAIAKARRKPFVFWTTIWWNAVTPLGQMSLPFLRGVYRGAHAIVTDGDQISRFVVGHGIDPGKIFTAEFSVDNEWFMRPVADAERQARRAALGATTRPLILAVSRLVPEKGIDVLVRAAAILADLAPIVAVAGTGPLAGELEALAVELAVDLRLLGGLEPTEMPALYAAADVYTMPSVTTPAVREPWGLGVNEAHCQRIPVVASDAVGAAAGGLVVHDESGLIVPERDEVALAEALRRVLTGPEVGARLAAAGHDRVQATNYDAMVDSFVAAMRYAVASHAGDMATAEALRAVRFRPPR
jgi:glycosyltransferase involved in cell wall biosynthesis